MNRIFALIVICTLTSGCSEHSKPVAHTEKQLVATPTVFNAAGAPTVEFNVPDMMCAEGCGLKVKEILSAQPGAKEVLVNFDAKKATVAIGDDDKFDSHTALAALVDHQFNNSSLKNESSEGGQSPAVVDPAPPAADEKPAPGAAG